MKKKLIKKADLIIIILLTATALCLAIFSFSGKPREALIYMDGKLIHSVKLSDIKEPELIELDNGITVLIEKDGISITESDCPSKDCISCGKLTTAGSSAVCVPNRTVIKLKGGKSDSTDAVSY